MTSGGRHWGLTATRRGAAHLALSPSPRSQPPEQPTRDPPPNLAANDIKTLQKDIKNLQDDYENLRGRARDTARVTRTAVLYLRGVARDTINQAFKLYKDEAKVKRELQDQNAREGAAFMTWKSRLFAGILTWLSDAAPSDSPKFAHVPTLLQMNVNAVVDRVQFHKPECPSDSSPWNAALYFQSTPDGISARNMLLFELTEYYKTSTGAAATISVGFDRYTDRALTKELAEWVELPTKGRSKGKGKGDASSSSGPKRRSPEHGNGSRGARPSNEEKADGSGGQATDPEVRRTAAATSARPKKVVQLRKHVWFVRGNSLAFRNCEEAADQADKGFKRTDDFLQHDRWVEAGRTGCHRCSRSTGQQRAARFMLQHCSGLNQQQTGSKGWQDAVVKKRAVAAERARAAHRANAAFKPHVLVQQADGSWHCHVCLKPIDTHLYGANVRAKCSGKAGEWIGCAGWRRPKEEAGKGTAAATAAATRQPQKRKAASQSSGRGAPAGGDQKRRRVAAIAAATAAATRQPQKRKAASQSSGRGAPAGGDQKRRRVQGRAAPHVCTFSHARSARLEGGARESPEFRWVTLLEFKGYGGQESVNCFVIVGQWTLRGLRIFLPVPPAIQSQLSVAETLWKYSWIGIQKRSNEYFQMVHTEVPLYADNLNPTGAATRGQPYWSQRHKGPKARLHAGHLNSHSAVTLTRDEEIENVIRIKVEYGGEVGGVIGAPVKENVTVDWRKKSSGYPVGGARATPDMFTTGVPRNEMGDFVRVSVAGDRRVSTELSFCGVMDVERSSDLSSSAPDDSVTVVSGRDTVEVQLELMHDLVDSRVHDLGIQEVEDSNMEYTGNQEFGYIARRNKNGLNAEFGRDETREWGDVQGTHGLTHGTHRAGEWDWQTYTDHHPVEMTIRQGHLWVPGVDKSSAPKVPDIARLNGMGQEVENLRKSLAEKLDGSFGEMEGDGAARRRIAERDEAMDTSGDGRMQTGRAAGEDGFVAEYLKYGGEVIRNKIIEMVQRMWRYTFFAEDGHEADAWPAEWKIGLVVPLWKKKGERQDKNTWRGVTLLSVGTKLLARVVASRLARWVCKDGMWEVFKRRGCPAGMVKLARAIHEHTAMKVRIHGGCSETYVPDRGLREGCPSSPVLFNIYHDAVMQDFRHRRLKSAAERGETPGLTWAYKVDGRLSKRQTDRAQQRRHVRTVLLGDFGCADDTAIVGMAGEALQAEQLFANTLADWEEKVHPGKNGRIEDQWGRKPPYGCSGATNRYSVWKNAQLGHKAKERAFAGQAQWLEKCLRAADIPSGDWFRLAQTRSAWRNMVSAAFPTSTLTKEQKKDLDKWRPGRPLPNNTLQDETTEQPDEPVGPDNENSGDEVEMRERHECPMQMPLARLSLARGETMAVPQERHMYTDGSGGDGSGVAGWGAVAYQTMPKRPTAPDYVLYGPVVTQRWDPVFLGAERGTNNTGELTAIGEACLWLIEHEDERFGAQGELVPAWIHYDSEYACDLAARRSTPTSNMELAERIAQLVEQVRARRPLRFKHVKGHSNDVGNDAADKYADWGSQGRATAQWRRWSTAPPAWERFQGTDAPLTEACRRCGK
ncbi:unnamed protein product, partial [Polarella glacialis]